MNDLRKTLEEAVRRNEHERNLRGVTRKACEVCTGRGHTDSWTDEFDRDHYVTCPACRGTCCAEVPCTPAKLRAALRREIKALQKRLKYAGG